MIQPIELLAPAGSLDKLKYAYAYGADAAYIGLPYFSLRARENDISHQELIAAKELSNKLNKKLFVTLNIFSRNRKIKNFESQINQIIALKPDALIMSDPGLISIVRERSAHIPIHLSVQANCMNYKSVLFWHKALNIERIILSRELSLDEIKEIKQKAPEVELEAFVHGSICIAYSGRCLLSSYLSYRDANQGVCDNSCREKYKLKEYTLEDFRNPGAEYPIEEDEDGTFIMNAKDLCLIAHLKEIVSAGVSSLKIEGRSKSEYYVAMVCRAYRKALDDLAAGKDFDSNLIFEINKISNRGYHKGFIIPQARHEMQNYETSLSQSSTHQFSGLLIQENTPHKNYYPFKIRNHLKMGDNIEIMGPQMTGYKTTVTKMLNSQGKLVETANGGPHTYFINLPTPPPPYAIMSTLCEKN